MRQYLDVKAQYNDCIVLFRMGDFFETFLDDAKITSDILGIVLTKRSNGAASDVPLAGFPHHALDNYLPKLVKAGYKVAICEQVEDPKQAKGIVKREVIEIVSPGTLPPESGDKLNHFIAAIHQGKDKAGFAVLDQSTGDFFIGECATDDLHNALAQWKPAEVIISDNISYSLTTWYKSLRPYISSIEEWQFNYDQNYQRLVEHFQVKSLKGFGCDMMTDGIVAGGIIFYHIRNNLKSRLDHVRSIHPVRQQGVMGIDDFTFRNLEVFSSLSTQGTHGTLIAILDQTVTPGGGRLLRQWLSRPLMDLERLSGRHAIVQELLDNRTVLDSLRQTMKLFPDFERILGRLNKFSAGPREIRAMGTALDRIIDLKQELSQPALPVLTELIQSLKPVDHIAATIQTMLHEDCPASLRQGNVIATGVDEKLDELRSLSSGGKEWMTAYVEEEKERTGISSLKIGFNRVFGYYIEVTHTHRDKIPSEYIRKQTLVNSERYITEALKEYEERILNAEAEIAIIEEELFHHLCRDILQVADKIQHNARVLNKTDVLGTFAQTALQNEYIRPELTEDRQLIIHDGRHPVVEKLLPATEKFIPNDTRLDATVSQIHLITGPNMAGKSTYLRQVGLLVLMAQIGSFIPAKSATIGLVDYLFTRVGASDNLAGGESTFLVEMNEAANILNNATPSSLILLDEIGRGTATYDGLSLAWAITEYIHEAESLQARTVFATHYHELTDLENTLDRLHNYHVAVKEFGDKIVFIRKVLPGAGDKSYGIHVAKMAGLPSPVINRATEILEYYLQHSETKPGTFRSRETSNQINLFGEQEEQLRKDLAEMEIDTLSPLEALNRLYELKAKHGL